MANIVYRLNSDFLVVFTKRNSIENKTYMPITDFRFSYERDPITGLVVRAVITDTENIIAIINLSSDDECMDLFGITLDDYVRDVENGLL